MSNSQISSYGYERKVIETLTLQCKEFRAIAALKSLETEYGNLPEMKRRLRARGYNEARIDQAVNTADRYEFQEGLLYRMEYDPRFDAISMA